MLNSLTYTNKVRVTFIVLCNCNSCMPSTFLFYREVNFFDGAVFKCTAIMTNFIRVDSLKGTSYSYARILNN